MANNLCKINGIVFDVDVAISAYKRSFNVLHGENAGRVLSGDMILDPKGTYLGRNITFFRKGNDYKSIDALWDYLVAHSLDEDGVMLEAADGQSTISFRCYYSSSEQDLVRRDKESGINYWGEFSVNFIPMSAQVRP